jgi:stringent starvation protein B
MTEQLPPKKDVALALLERSNVDIHLDPRAKGVVVPPQFRKEPRLILKIGLNMPVPIPDLRVDDESMSCTLSFSRTPFYCVVPWPSVFAIVGEDGRGMVWPDDVPQELAVRLVDDKSEKAEKAEKRPALAAVESPASSGRGRGGKKKEEEPTSDRPARGGKKGKKKKDERPVLVAVPAPAPSEPRPSEPRPGELRPSEPRPGEPRAVPVPEPAVAQRPKDGVSPVPRAPQIAQRSPNRPKRELPPYLRVVK